MIIGSGRIASEFYRQVMHENKVIFASGVSDSQCKDASQFMRERSLLESQLKKFKDVDKFVYVSTCSIYDKSLETSDYVKHKKEMEQIVLGAHRKPVIFRYPIIVEKLRLSNNLLDVIYNNILNNRYFEIWEHAIRNLICISDAIKISNLILSDNLYKKYIYNIANTQNYSILEIVRTIEEITKKKGNFKIIKKGSSYEINVQDIMEILKLSCIEFNEDYLYRILKNYK